MALNIWPRFISHSSWSLNVNIRGHRHSHQYMCFWQVMWCTQAVSFKCCVLVSLNQKREVGSAFEQRGNTNERRWRRARGGNARAHRPSSSSWCRHTCQRTDRRRPANLLPFLSVTELNLSELPWGIAVWRRSHCYWWVNLQRTSYHICVWRASHPPFGAAVCFGWEHSVYLIEAATAGLRFTEQWCVGCAFSKGCECFVIFLFKTTKPIVLPVW